MGRTVVTLHVEHGRSLPKDLMDRVMRVIYDACAVGGDQVSVCGNAMEVKEM